jgi:hypothetical protein
MKNLIDKLKNVKPLKKIRNGLLYAGAGATILMSGYSCATKQGTGALVGSLLGPIGALAGAEIGNSMDNQDRRIRQLENQSLGYNFEISFINLDTGKKDYNEFCYKLEECTKKMSNFGNNVEKKKFPKNGYHVLLIEKNTNFVSCNVKSIYDSETNKIKNIEM